MAHPTTTLRWANSPTTLRTEPPEGTKDTGFAVNAKLPAQYFNWLSGIAGDWITWLYSIVHSGSDFSFFPVAGSLYDLGNGAKRWVTTYTEFLNASKDVTAGTYVNPTSAHGTRVLSDAVGLRVTDSVGTLRTVACASPISDNVDQAINVSYLTKCLCNFIGFEHDYGVSPFEITGVRTYMPFSSYTPTIAPQGIVANAFALECDEAGLYHVSVALKWITGPASAYARVIVVDVGGVEHLSFAYNEVSGAVARTQVYSLDVEVVNIATDVIRVAAYQGSGSSDYIQVVGVTVHQVGKRLV